MTQTFTLSALTDILSDAMSMYKDECNSSPGNYFYIEIKSFHFENRCINLKKSVLDCLEGKIDNFSQNQKKNLIIRALKQFAYRNIPDSDAEMFCKGLRFKIVI